MAGPTIEFKSNVDDQQIVQYFQKAKGLIFPSYEDFGIVPVEAMSAGTPVIAYHAGGAESYVIPRKTGIFFEDQTTESVAKAIQDFETKKFDSKAIIKHAEGFSEERFIHEIQQFTKKVGKL